MKDASAASGGEQGYGATPSPGAPTLLSSPFFFSKSRHLEARHMPYFVVTPLLSMLKTVAIHASPLLSMPPFGLAESRIYKDRPPLAIA